MKNSNLKTLGLKTALLCFMLLFYTLANSQSITINNYELVSKKTFPTITANLSGVTYNNETKTLFMVQNRPTNIYEISTRGNILRTIKLNGFDDTEGVIHISGTLFAVAEEKKGRIVFFDIEPGITEIEYSNTNYAQLPDIYGPWGANNGLEGLTYNRVTNQIVTLKESGPKGYFAFDLPTSFPAILSVTDVKTPCNIANPPFNELADLAGIHHQGTSAMIISQESKLLKHLYGCGVGISLPLADLTQPEGITFANDTLYIVGEPNELAIYSAPCVIGSACDDGDDCTENDQYDEACGCVGKPIPACGTCRYTDSLALVNIYQSFNGNFWDLSKPMNTWKGVILNEDGCVIELELNEDLRGELSSAIGDLRELTYLELSDNYISGNIPSEIGSLTKLETLKLDGNNFDGPLPSTFGNLQSLKYIQLQYNNISEIPASIGRLVNLISFKIRDNQLANLPSSIGNLANLTSLSLGNNLLTDIPSEVGNLSKLTLLGLNNNQLRSIPSSIGNLNQIEVLSWNDNQVSGQMPAWLSGLNLLRSLSIQNNEMRGCYKDELNILCDQLTPFNNKNNFISNGNNFDATWEDFCAAGNGSCTPPPPSCRHTDSLTLVEIYQSLNRAALIDSSKPINEWRGVSLNDNGCINKLVIVEKRLNGQLPAVIGNLSELTYLDLSENYISGPLPTELGNLTKLKYFNIRQNRIESPLPNSIENLINLEVLNANSNQLTEVTESIGNLNKLKELNLSENAISEIPASIGSLTSLTTLHLGSNQINELPASIGNLSNLTELNLQINQLPALPVSTGNLSNLTTLSLNYNKLATIGFSFSNLTNLETLLLDHNFLKELPNSIGDLSKLSILYINDNEMSGQLPARLASMPNLSRLQIQNNRLSGCYADELNKLCGQLWSPMNKNTYISNGNNFDASWEDFCSSNAGSCPIPNCHIDDWTALKALYESTNGDNWTNRAGWDVMIDNQNSPPANCDLSQLGAISLDDNQRVNYIYLWYNNLRGPLPPEIGLLSNLEGLWLSGGSTNFVTGPIPPEIGKLSNLKFLVADDNEISGNIPPEIGKLNNLVGLFLEKNQLSGDIPSEIGNLKNLESLYLFDNELTGDIPPEISTLNSLTDLVLVNNKLSGCYADELKKLCNQISPTFFIFMIGGVDAISYGNNFDITWEDFCAGTECLDFRRTINENNESYQSFNLPNPFTDQTSINYTLSSDSRVTISVYNSAGKRVEVLYNNELQETGNHSVVFKGKNLPAGVYYYRISSNDFDKMKKMVLIK